MTFAVRAALAASLTIGASGPGLAGATVPPAQANDSLQERCTGASTQAETLGCYAAAAAKSRAEVERAFERNLQTARALDREWNAHASHHILGSVLRKQLKVSQAAWLSYSQSQCSFEGGSSFGGSGTDILDAACHYRLNSQRLSELNAAYKLLNR